MIYLIEPSNYNLYQHELTEAYKLRHEIFYKKLKWQVDSKDGLEKDKYDEKNAYYLIFKDNQGTVRGCLRMIEMTNECMFDGPFQTLLPNLRTFKKPGIWEVSRFAVDDTAALNVHNISCKLLAALYYFGIKLRSVQLFCSINHPPVIKLYQQYEMRCCTLAEKKNENEHLIVAGYFPLQITFEKLIEKAKHDPARPILYRLSPYYSSLPQSHLSPDKKAL